MGASSWGSRGAGTNWAGAVGLEWKQRTGRTAGQQPGQLLRVAPAAIVYTANVLVCYVCSPFFRRLSCSLWWCWAWRAATCSTAGAAAAAAVTPTWLETAPPPGARAARAPTTMMTGRSWSRAAASNTHTVRNRAHLLLRHMYVHAAWGTYRTCTDTNVACARHGRKWCGIASVVAFIGLEVQLGIPALVG